jgi:diguanylate cyclase (GGDEF)-like protein
MRRPASVDLYVAATTLAAGAVLIWSLLATADEHPFGEETTLSLAFVALAAMADIRPLKWLPTNDGGSEVTASWTFWMVALMLMPLGWALLATALLTASIELVQRKPVTRMAFNASQLVLSLAAARVVIDLFASESDVAGRSFLWALSMLLGGTAAILLNGVMISAAIALNAHLPVARVVRQGVTVNLMLDGLLIALAPIFVVVADHDPALVLLLLLTVLAIYQSSRLALSHRHESMHDLLTQLPNRRHFMEYGSLALASAKRTSRPMAVVQIDLDGFKSINDRLGHHVGDLILREVSGRLGESMEAGDLAARMGGDEFVVLLNDVASLDAAVSRARAILDRIKGSMVIEGVPLSIGGSLGVAVFPDHAADLTTLLDLADTAMFMAKAAGSGVHLFEHDGEEVATGRLTLLADLPGALARDDQLMLAYQPQIRLRDGIVTGAEALLRWRHPVHGFVPPMRFIPVVEQTELMAPLTEFVLRTAFAEAARWREVGHDLCIAVNASARNLLDGDFVKVVKLTAAEARLPATAIEIEVTESAMMSDTVRARLVLQQLRETGIQVALDDFGTGYSSLTALRDMPIDRIKLDRSYVTNLAHNVSDEYIVRSMIDLAHHLGIAIVAEGVEDEETQSLLTELGCDEAQGHHIARPGDPLTLLAMAAVRPVTDEAATA